MSRELVDHSGKRFGSWEVLRRYGGGGARSQMTPSGGPLWWCRCECGRECVREFHWALEGISTPCRCAVGQRRLIDETGNRYGRLTVLTQHAVDASGAMRWVCRCDCGAEHVARGGDLRSGGVGSCGCLGRSCAASADGVPACRWCGRQFTSGSRCTRKWCRERTRQEIDRKRSSR